MAALNENVGVHGEHRNESQTRFFCVCVVVRALVLTMSTEDRQALRTLVFSVFDEDKTHEHHTAGGRSILLDVLKTCGLGAKDI